MLPVVRSDTRLHDLPYQSDRQRLVQRKLKRALRASAVLDLFAEIVDERGLQGEEAAMLFEGRIADQDAFVTESGHAVMERLDGLGWCSQANGRANLLQCLSRRLRHAGEVRLDRFRAIAPIGGYLRSVLRGFDSPSRRSSGAPLCMFRLEIGQLLLHPKAGFRRGLEDAYPRPDLVDDLSTLPGTAKHISYTLSRPWDCVQVDLDHLNPTIRVK